MKLKSQKFLDIFSIVCAILLFVGLIALSVFAVKVSIEQIENTCYADSTNGVVEDNIFYNPDFSLTGVHLVPNTSIGTFVRSDVYKIGNSVVSSDDDGLFFVNSSGSGGLRFLFSASQGTYTLALYGTNLLGKYFRIRNLDWYSYVNITVSNTFYSNDLLVYTFSLNSASYNNIYMLQIDFQDVWSSNISWFKVEKGTSFTGYVPNDYKNYGYDQGYNDGQISGYNQYLDNYAITDYLNVDECISVGGFSFTSYNVDYDVLLAKDVENHTRTGNEGLATIYDSLLANVNYNIIYTQGSFPSVSSTVYNGVAGFYGLKVSLQFNAINNFIPAGTPFSLNLVSGRANIDRTSGLYREVPFNIAFLTSNGEFVSYDYSLFFANNYYLNNTRILASEEYNETILGDTLNSGEVHYYRLPYDIYGIFLGSTHESGDYYHAYNIKLQFLPNGDYQSAYDQGFTAGQSDVNTQSFYNYGYNVGYDAGHRDGVLENTDYSFLGLIGAVFDAPVQAFSGLLDFNLLGVNLKSFVLAMLSLSVIIIVLKIALGGST